VTRKAINVPIVGQHNFVKAIFCIDSTSHKVNVSKTTLSYYNGIYIPNDDYFASDFLLDEWLPLIPNRKGMYDEISSVNRSRS
jgi:hypothetical protein